MFNYVKSEFYRITHWTVLYAAAFAFAAAPALMNLMLFGFHCLTPDFPWSTTSFSYSNIVANPMFFCMAALFVVFTLYEGNKKNGNLKNVVASGISREKILIGQFIVCLTVSVIFLAITVCSLIFSANLLLRNEGPVQMTDLFKEIMAAAPIAVAALILGIVVAFLFEKTFAGIVFWLCVFFFVPQVLFYIGLEIEPVRKAAMWLPRNFFAGMQVNQSVCDPIWNTSAGLARCLISGFAGMVVFSVFGFLRLRKKEL